MAEQPLPMQADPEDAYELFLQEHPGRGTLRVQVSTAGGTFPVPQAVVEVSRVFGGVRRTLYRAFTNQSGIVDQLILPALPAAYSQQESTAIDSGTQYQVSVSRADFIPLSDKTIEVYDRVDTILPVALRPSMS